LWGLTLDEPTSGLDSTASHEIISCLRATAQEHGVPPHPTPYYPSPSRSILPSHLPPITPLPPTSFTPILTSFQMIVIASIHQPSTTTLELFDNVLLLSQGKPVYFGPPNHSTSYFSSLGYPPDPMMSSAEFMLELTNVDFSRSGDEVARLEQLVNAWTKSRENKVLAESILGAESRNGNRGGGGVGGGRKYPRGLFMQSLILTHRMALVVSLFLLLFYLLFLFYLVLSYFTYLRSLDSFSISFLIWILRVDFRNPIAILLLMASV
jgi:ABC-2 type transporter